MHAVKAQLVEETIAGQAYWLAETTVPTARLSAAYLLPPYDEFTVAYRDRSAVLDPEHAEEAGNGIFSPTIVVNGRIVGTWKRLVRNSAITVTLNLFTALSQSGHRAVATAVRRYGRFMGMPVEVSGG